MEIIGKHFEAEEYFAGGLIYTDELMTGPVAILKSGRITGNSNAQKAEMVLCAVKDNLHNIGPILRFYYDIWLIKRSASWDASHGERRLLSGQRCWSEIL